ncbi:unnamed protein product [Effrenium voratum]|uniref:Major facilitator superfamily (MFS) profile domain-containing protein n=1 Tax=Effrenium voratum TaxID=2562239 RepID=A0AA36MI87_9DINO|nr:unnamed protein product [Effrenium voratum]CAJ1429401.1 unnamed protein product [Effrenium voratum]
MALRLPVTSSISMSQTLTPTLTPLKQVSPMWSSVTSFTATAAAFLGLKSPRWSKTGIPTWNSRTINLDYDEKILQQQFASAIQGATFQRQHLIMLAAGFCSFFSLGALNDPVGLAFPGFQEEWGPLAPNALAAAASCSTLGQTVALLMAGSLADRLGRRTVARLGTLLGLCGVLTCFSAPSLQALSMGRFMGGFGLGATLVALPTLLTECFPQSHSRLLVTYQCAWPLAAFCYAIWMQRFGWRAATGASLPVLAALLVLTALLAESPRNLLARGHLREAEKQLKRLGANLNERRDSSEEVVKASGITANWRLYLRFLVCFFLCGMASQLVKVWLPTIMSRFGRSGGSGGAFVLMWGVEAVGIISMALMFGGQTTSKKEPVSTALEGQLRVCCLSFFLACNCVMAILEVENLSVIGVLGGVHLVSQAAAFNFLFPFASSTFEPAVRGRLVAGLLLASQVGCFVGPLVGSAILQASTGPFSGTVSLCTAGAAYFIGSMLVRGLMRRLAGRKR